MLSGIGPAAELQQLGLSIVHDLPGIGRNLNDRLYIEVVTTQEAGSHNRTSYIDSPDKLETARQQWSIDQSGPLTGYYMPQMVGYLKSDKTLGSDEFGELEETTKSLFRKTTKPAFEILSVSDLMLFSKYFPSSAWC